MNPCEPGYTSHMNVLPAHDPAWAHEDMTRPPVPGESDTLKLAKLRYHLERATNESERSGWLTDDELGRALEERRSARHARAA